MLRSFTNLAYFVLFFAVFALSCKPKQALSNNTETASIQNWLGHYEGTMQMHQAGSTKPPHQVKMQLDIAPTAKNNEWTWIVSYQDSLFGNVVKNYALIHPDSLPNNVFWMDEKNGILLSEVLIGNTFYGAFEFGDMFITSHFSKIKDTIYYDVITMPNRATFTNVLTYNGTADTIRDYQTQNVQKAILIKKKK